MRVLIAEQHFATYAQLLDQQAPELEVLTPSDSPALAEQANHCEIWLGQPDLLCGLLRQGLRPRWLQSTWAGITPLLAPALPRDYLLTRAVGIFGQVMAEYVLTYILNHERMVLSRLVSQVERKWDDRLPKSVFGRRVLIVGIGDIGQHVARCLAPFGMKLTGVASTAREQAPFTEVAGLGELGRLVGQADYVVNLLPSTPHTEDIYDAALFARFNPEAVFINAGRGSSVVDADLVDALKQGHLAGAVIDVCRQEPLPQRHPFWTAWGLLLTGHSAAHSSPELMTALFLKNLAAYRAGEALQGQVDFERGY